MRKVTEISIAAFLAGRTYRSRNTTVKVLTNEIELILFDHVIAIKSRGDGGIQITNCGFKTKTTKERLNGIAGVSIHQKRGNWWLNGMPWDGSWKKVEQPITVRVSPSPRTVRVNGLTAEQFYMEDGRCINIVPRSEQSIAEDVHYNAMTREPIVTIVRGEEF